MRSFCAAILLALGWVTALAPADEKQPDKRKADAVQVPYRLADTKHVVVRAKINGKGPFNLVIDTGAPAFYTTKAVGKKLGLEADKNGWVTFDRFELEGGLVIPKAQGRMEDIFQLEGMNGLGAAGVELHGLLGYNILARYKIEYDFTRDKMSWTRLDYEPDMPVRLGKGGTGSLEVMGSVMKALGAIMGKKADHDVVLRGFLGVEVRDVEGRVEVKSVLEKGPSAVAGVKAGDRIHQLQDADVKSAADFHKLAAKLKPGDPVRIRLERDNQKRDINFEAGKGL